MKRVHLFEFEDLGWFPGWLRSCMTHLLALLVKLLGVDRAVGALVKRTLDAQGLDQIVDLGSGAGGAMPAVLKALHEQQGRAGVCLTMTDLYPNKEAVARFEALDDPRFRYLPEPVDATRIASAPAGLRTMVNCFHHMRPNQARAILDAARRDRQPLLIYERVDNRIPLLAWWLTLPLGLFFVATTALLMTPLLRPLSARQIFFTYVIPLIPLCYAWDGQASMPRIYNFEDMDTLLQGLETEGYRWEKGRGETSKGRPLGIYLLGTPSDG